MAKNRNSLGRGLGALLSEIEEAYENDINENKTSRIEEVELDKIEPNPYQPRKNFDQSQIEELSQSIQSHGLLQPILLIKNGQKYIIVAGERRFRASKLAGLIAIKAVVADYDLSKIRELALIENIQRENLNPIELALSYEQLLNDYNITQEELSVRLQKSRSQIANTLRLLKLDEEIQHLIVENKISAGHAKALIGLDKKTQVEAVENILNNNFTVRQVEDLTQKVKQPKPNEENIQLNEFGEFFAYHGIKTKIVKSKLTIDFSDPTNVKKMLILIGKSQRFNL